MSEASPTSGQRQLQRKNRSAERVRLVATATRKRRAGSKRTGAFLRGWAERGEEVDGGAEDGLVVLVDGVGAGADDTVVLARVGVADADDFDLGAERVAGAGLGPVGVATPFSMAASPSNTMGP